jgi:hypothetical protein
MRDEERPTERGWNIFARELRLILQDHQADLSLMDNRLDMRGRGIHREKVRRLQKSLQMPKSFPTLNPEEMELLIALFDLTEPEEVRLRAAILATAIEEKLMGRIDPFNAWRAADEIFPIIWSALQLREGRVTGMSVIRKEGQGMSQETELAEPFEQAFITLDRATIALHLCYSVEAASLRIIYGREARDAYIQAAKTLEAMDARLHRDASWQFWHQEAQDGASASSDVLKSLGVIP